MVFSFLKRVWKKVFSRFHKKGVSRISGGALSKIKKESVRMYHSTRTGVEDLDKENKEKLQEMF